MVPTPKYSNVFSSLRIKLQIKLEVRSPLSSNYSVKLRPFNGHLPTLEAFSGQVFFYSSDGFSEIEYGTGMF